MNGSQWEAKVKMKHPFLEIPRPRRWPFFLVFLVLTLLTMFALNLTGRSLFTSAAPSGIISYEFAGDVPTAGEIIDSWDESARINAGFNIGLDYLYLVLYSSTIAMALLWLSENLPVRWLVSLAILLAWAQWLAAALDAIENYALFTMLAQVPAEPWPQIAWWCAALKFALIIAGLLVVLIALVILIARRFRVNE